MCWCAVQDLMKSLHIKELDDYLLLCDQPVRLCCVVDGTLFSIFLSNALTLVGLAVIAGCKSVLIHSTSWKSLLFF